MAEIVIPVCGRGDLLARLMPLLEGHEVILVDDASPDGETRDLVRRYADVKGVRAFFNESNMGFPAAVNRGARVVKGDRFFLLNTDVQPERGWDVAMSRTIEADPGVAVVGGLLLFPDALTVQHAGVEFRADGLPVHRYRYFTRHAPELLRPIAVTMVSFAATLIRTAAFREIGGMDEDFGPGMYDDCDACLRLGEMGWGIAYQPCALFLHDESASFSTRGDDLAIRMRGKDRFLKKWVDSGRWMSPQRHESAGDE